MKHVTLVIAVMATVLAAAATTAAAQEEEEEFELQEELERREIELDIQRLEHEAEFECQQQELDLEQRRLEIDLMRGHKPGHDDGGQGLFLLLVIISHILLTVWVFKDMNEKKIGRALWVPIVLLTGVFGAILYAIVRVADTRAK
jgi:hypothetical protein